MRIFFILGIQTHLIGNARGVEVILSYQSLEYFNFANEVCNTISKTLNTPNRGVIFKDFHTREIIKSGKVSQLNYYGELRNNKARCAILVELCFHDNITDGNSLIKNKDILIFNIAKVIEKNFNLKKKIQKIKVIKNQIYYQIKILKLTIIN